MVAGLAMWPWVSNVVSILTALTLLVGLLAIVDRFVGGRLRHGLRGYLGIAALKNDVDELQDAATRRGSKLDHLHEEHRMAMVADHDLSVALNELSKVVCDVHDIGEEERPPRLDTDRMAQRAEQAGAAWPGEFLRGHSPSDND